MDCKYVVINNGGLAGETIIVFPAFISHRELKSMGSIISAGFIGRDDSTRSGLYCYGKSDTLGLECRKDQDQMLLDMMLKKEF